MNEEYKKREIVQRIKEIIASIKGVENTGLPAPLSREDLEYILDILEPDTGSAPVAARPHIEKRGKWWVLFLPKKRDVRVTKQGHLGGELLGVLTEHDKWGKDLSREYVLAQLKSRVKNKAIQKDGGVRRDPTIKQIKEAVKDINQKLKKNGIRGIKLVETRTTLGVMWKFMLDVRPAPWIFRKPKNPPRSKKRSSIAP